MTRKKPGKPPSFQFYANDWLSSPKIILMTPSQEGAYIRLLCYAWADPNCSLPDDDDALAQLSRLGEEWFRGSGTVLRQCFIAHPKLTGRLINVRLAESRKHANNWSAKSSIGGINSAKAKAFKRHDGPTTLQPSGNQLVGQWCNSSSSSSSSSSLNSYRERRKVSGGHTINDRTAGFDLFWSAYPRKEGKGKCRAWWKRQKPDAALVSAMLAKIEQAKQTKKWTDDGGKYIPMPATWLHEERWEDEFAARPAAPRPMEVVL